MELHYSRCHYSVMISVFLESSTECVFYPPNPIRNSGRLSGHCHLSVAQGLRNALAVIPVTAYKMLIMYLNSIADENQINENQMYKDGNENSKVIMAVKQRIKA